MQKKRKRWVRIILVIVLIIFIFGVTDYLRVVSFEKPIFAIGRNLADDGGSGTYVGLGYYFRIEGKFLPEDELKGVTKFDYYILGIRVLSGVRD